MGLSDYYKAESKWLRADDLREGMEIKLIIDHIEIEMVDRDDGKAPEEKAVVYFQAKEKGLMLNATNGKKLVEAYGDDLEGLRLKEVILYRDTVDFKGTIVPCLRIRIPQQEVAADDVPF